MPLAHEKDLAAMVDAIELLEKELARYGANFQDLIEVGEVLVKVDSQAELGRLAAALSYYTHATDVLRHGTVHITYHRDLRFVNDGLVICVRLTDRKVH